ncbi:MAG: M23 family metallopeptidase [Thermoanaerobaculia bacterium]
MSRNLRVICRVALIVAGAAFVVQHVVSRRAPHVESAAPSRTTAAQALNPDSLVLPVEGVSVTDLRDSFNAPRSGHLHEAIDIPAPRGTPVLAVAAGRILKLHESPAGGHTIYLAGPRRHLVYYYAHLDHYAFGLREGAEVKRGEVIGFVGTSGNAPKNFPHLHFGVERPSADGAWWKGTSIDPYPILVGHDGQTDGAPAGVAAIQ